MTKTKPMKYSYQVVLNINGELTWIVTPLHMWQLDRVDLSRMLKKGQYRYAQRGERLSLNSRSKLRHKKATK